MIKTIRLIAISFRGGPTPVFQLMFSLFSKSIELNMGLLDSFIAILEPSVVGPVVYEGFIPAFMHDFLKFIQCKMPNYAFSRSLKILIIVFDCYPCVFNDFFTV